MPLEDQELLPPASEDELDRLEQQIDGWLRVAFDENPIMVALDRGAPGERRWYVRLAGESKDFTTVWLKLGQRALHAEAYMMPAPEENEGELYEHLLRRNRSMHGVSFAIGVEDAIFVIGAVPLEAISEGHLDRLVGSIYEYVERWFPAAIRIGFASRIR